MSDRDFGNLQWRESSATAESLAATAAASPGFARSDVDEAEGESGDSCDATSRYGATSGLRVTRTIGRATSSGYGATGCVVCLS